MNIIFKTLNKNISKFIWNHKVPRLSLEKLSWDCKMGGLRLPNLKFYYWAAQMRFLLPLFGQDPAPSWTQIELYDLDEEVKSDVIYKWDQ